MDDFFSRLESYESPKQAEPKNDFLDRVDSYEKAHPSGLSQEERMGQAREFVGKLRGAEKEIPELGGIRVRDIKIPFASAIGDAAGAQRMGTAQKAFQLGRATDEQLATLAIGEYEQERNKAKGLGGQIGQAVGSLPAIAGEAMVGGGAVRGAAGAVGLGRAVAGATSTLGRAAQGAGTMAAATPAMPSTWLAQSQERANQNGGNWYDPSNVSPPLAHAAMSNALLGQIGAMTKGGIAKRIAIGAAAMPAEQGAADALMTVADKAMEAADVPKKWQTETKFGTIGKLVRGEEGGLKDLAVQSLLGAGFAAFHGNGAKPVEKFAEAVDFLEKGGMSKGTAAAVLQESLTKPPESLPDTPVKAFVEESQKAQAPEPPKTANAEAVPEPAKPAVEPEKATETKPWEVSRDEFVKSAPKPDRHGRIPTVENLLPSRLREGEPGVSIQNDSGNVRHVVERDAEGNPVGVLSIQNAFEHNGTKYPASILGVAVDPKMQRQGIATRLYDAAEKSGFDVKKATGEGGYTEAGARFAHRRSVAEALSRGEKVTESVLKDYPDLKPPDRRGEARPETIDRRINAPERKRVVDMTPEERAKELLTSQTVELPNRRAFDEAGPAKVVAMSDADGLKAFNDKFGYEAGDKLLRAKAEALKAAGLDAYHEKGDEFLFRGEDQKDLSAKMEKAREILRNTDIVVAMSDGSVRTFKGADFSYGVGNEISKAEAGLKGHKAEREARGERSRGELRGIVEVGKRRESGKDSGSPVAEKVAGAIDIGKPEQVRAAIAEGVRGLKNYFGHEPDFASRHEGAGNKFFISDVFDAIKGRLPKGMTLEKFKEHLKNNRDQFDLSRLDLVQVVKDKGKIARNEINDGNAQWHLIDVPNVERSREKPAVDPGEKYWGKRAEKIAPPAEPPPTETPSEVGPEFGKPLTAQEQRLGKISGASGEADGPAPGYGPKETALANAVVDRERVENGLPPLMEAAREANAEVWDSAMARLSEDANLSSRLVDELANNPRATTVEENALLLHRKIALNNQYERVVRQAVHAARNDPSQFERLDGMAVELLGQIDKLDKVTKATGTEWGRAGQFRKQLAAEDFSLSRMMNEATRQKRSPLTPEEQQKIVDLNAEITRLNKIIADLEAAGTAGKIGAKPKIDGMDATGAKVSLNRAKREYSEMTDAFKRSNQSPGKKALEGVKEVNNIRRALITAYDLSAVLRQGAMLSYRHPFKAVTAFKEMLKSAKSKDYYERAEMDLRTERDNGRFGNYDRSGLYLADDSGPMTKQEESFMGRFVGKIPGVAASNRAFNSYLNRIRADVFDGLVENLSRDGKATHAEMKDIANFINAASGRGILRPSLDGALTKLSQVFFSPRYLVSRLQILSGQPFFGASSWRTRKIIAKEYAGSIAGLALVYGVAKAFGAELEGDTRSADFGKLKVGRTRLDPLAGLSQVAVLARRLFSGETKSTDSGKVQDLRGDKHKFGTDTTSDKAMRFARNKLAPLAGDVSDTVFPEYTPPGTGMLTDIAGKPKGVKGWAIRQADKAIPISFNDIYDAMKEQGFSKGSAISILSLLGMGQQLYDHEHKKK